ncbi:DUF2975 domain-containing protein [Kibdelosporangium philippinense]|uniref:DUF2975 domain-containing protein n=1 Tax=Kibdelosporangium philippinense TaxID=211113 RepID=A0ABS8ZYR5_9PSEU|nr:DUF2975 domain-containing protein [Kibdelosporangium philippinense]MCE7011322.1 DUF2975 domain-containing protein [Kibdelosporangium philippinense]
MQRDPLEPMDSTVKIIISLLAVVVVLSVPAAIWGSSSTMGIGGPSVCVEAPSGVVYVPQSVPNLVGNPAEGVVSSAVVVSLCDSTPDFGQRLLGALTVVPGFLALVGGLLLFLRLFRGMRREGLFGDRVPGLLKSVGVYVIVAGLGVTLLESVVRFWLTNSMVLEPIPGLSWLGGWDWPEVALFLGIIMISFGRIMRVSTAMCEELDGTV